MPAHRPSTFRLSFAAAPLLVLACDAPPSPEPPAPLIDEVAEALGASALPATAVERVTASGQRFEPGEGYRPSEPLFMSDFSVERAAAIDAAQLEQSLEIDAKAVLPQALVFTETIDAAVGFVQGTDNIFGNDAEETPLFSGRIAGQLRHAELTSPLRLVALARALDDEGRLAERPEAEHDGRMHRVLALEPEGEAPTLLYIDPSTRLVAKAETLEDHPPNGDTRVEVRFSDYREADGAMIPFSLTIVADGTVVHTETRTSAEVVDAGADAFAVPDPFHMEYAQAEAARARQASQWYAGFFHGGFSFFYFDQWGSAVEDVEVAPGVHLLRGPSHHNLLVEQDDSLVLVDAPMYDGRTLALLEHIRAQPYGNKPLRHVVATHFHQDHVGGIRALAAEGDVTVVAGSPSVEYFEEVFSRPHTLAPDRFATSPVPVTVQGVDDAFVIEDAERPVALYRITNSHAHDMLIVHLPEQRLLFSADLYGPNPYTVGGPLQGDYLTWAGELYDEVARRGLEVEVVTGAHGEGTATLEDVRIGGGR